MAKKLKRGDAAFEIDVTIRDYFAAAAIEHCLASCRIDDDCVNYEAAAAGAYAVADAMIEARKIQPSKRGGA